MNKYASLMSSLASLCSVAALLGFFARYLHPATFTANTVALLTAVAVLAIAATIASQPHGS